MPFKPDELSDVTAAERKWCGCEYAVEENVCVLVCVCLGGGARQVEMNKGDGEGVRWRVLQSRRILESA